MKDNTKQVKKRRDTITKKRVKVVGTKKFIDADTNEVQEMLVTTVEDRDFNFVKVWMMSLLPQLEIIGNKKISVCMWIIDHLNRDNQLLYTQRQIADESGISLYTVTETVKALMDSDFLRKRAHGIYIVNPDILWKGTSSARMNALFQFQCTDGAPSSTVKELELEGIEKNIASLQKKKRAVTEKIKQMKLEDEVEKKMKEMDLDPDNLP